MRTYDMVKVTLNTTTLTLLSDRFTRKLQYCHLFDLKLGVTYFDTETPIYVSDLSLFFFYLETFRKVIWRLLATKDSRYMMSVTICSWPKYFHMQSYPSPHTKTPRDKRNTKKGLIFLISWHLPRISHQMVHQMLWEKRRLQVCLYNCYCLVM